MTWIWGTPILGRELNLKVKHYASKRCGKWENSILDEMVMANGHNVWLVVWNIFSFL